MLDLSGAGFELTDAAHGVPFNFAQSGLEMLSWTAPGSHNAWLVLDRNGNGRIDDGTELFGNITPQPPSDNQNGFAALAMFDRPENGGNGDGIIDDRDSVYQQLRLWEDANHNGVAEPWELTGLAQRGIVSISLDYSESNQVDKWGNRFRYRARVVTRGGAGKWAYDVFLTYQPMSSSSTTGLKLEEREFWEVHAK